MAFAIIDRTKKGVESVVMILDEKEEAEAIAFELGRKHIDVAVVEFDAAAEDGPP